MINRTKPINEGLVLLCSKKPLLFNLILYDRIQVNNSSIWNKK